MCFVGVAVMAAVLDYLHALKKGRVKWGLIAFALHVVLGAFIGSLCVMLAIGLGYDAWVGGAAAGMGGLLNVRAVELLENYLRAKGVIKLERRKEEKMIEEVSSLQAFELLLQAWATAPWWLNAILAFIILNPVAIILSGKGKRR